MIIDSRKVRKVPVTAGDYGLGGGAVFDVSAEIWRE